MDYTKIKETTYNSFPPARLKLDSFCCCLFVCYLAGTLIKMVPNRGAADRIWPKEDCRWHIDIVVSFHLL